MNNIGRNKTNWLFKNDCVFIEEPNGYDDGTSTSIYTKYHEYVGLADLGNDAASVNFIYKHRLTNLMSINRAKGLPLSKYSCNAVSIGFNEKEQKWYSWTHRGFCAFGIGYQVVKGSIMDGGNHKYPFVAKTLEDCLMLAIDIAEYLD